jgi:hypothetical protein
VIQTVAEPVALGAATLLAVMVCVLFAAGGWYKPEDEMVPTVEFPPTMPSTAHTTD